MDALLATTWIAWVTFILSAALVIYAGTWLSRLGDALSDRTGIGRVWIGSLLLAGATSLPEVSASAVAGWIGAPDLAVGNVFGSNIFNMTIIFAAQLTTRQPILGSVSQGHFITAAAGMLLSGLATAAILLKVPLQVLGVGADTLVILAAYLLLLRLLPKEDNAAVDAGEGMGEVAVTVSNQRSGSALILWLGFITAAAGVVLGGYLLSHSADAIASGTGWGESFVGNTLLAATTSLPELTVSIAAAARGSFDLAVGNVLGSNIFNMLILAVSDLTFRGPNVLTVAAPSQAVSALLGLILSSLVILGMTQRQGRRPGRLQWDTTAIFLTYLVGTYFLFVNR